MRNIILIIILFCSLNLSAQKKWRNYIVLGTSTLAAGMLDGSTESLSFHYNNGVKPHFTSINDQYWNPAISWTNKYKNGDVNQGEKFTGSTSFLVFTTDGYHLLRTLRKTADDFTIAYYVNDNYTSIITRKKKWRNLATDFLILTVIRSVGFSLTYSLIFNPQVHYKI